MKGKRIPLFKRASVVTKTAPETSAPASTGGSSTDLAPPGGTNVFEAPFVDTPIMSGGSSNGKESDSAPKVTVGYSATYLNLPNTLPGGYKLTEKSKLGTALVAFPATRPLLLEGIGKPYEEYIDPLELQGVISKHFVRGERASQFNVLLEKENEDLLRNQKTTYNEKKVATEQPLVEIAKCKDLEAQNFKLEEEKFDLTLKLSRLGLSLSQEKKRVEEAE
ncbi:hypothetical protein LIER_43640 [Lithospermum erythrorhizon]|uniref:Uncharacterized protein n=1 Tax=Lithospermum erythrorhizon TaxID=34254 RepID=A0AAV3QK79_LITER